MSRPRLSWPEWTAAGWLLMLVVAAVAAPSQAPFPNLLQANLPPGQAPFWLGTDAQGQGLGTLLLLGARTTLLVSLPAATLAVLLGAGLGSVAGFWGNAHWRVTQAFVLAAAVVGAGAVLEAAQLLAHPVWLLPLLLLGTTIWYGARHWAWGRRRRALPLDHAVQTLITLLDSVPLLVLVVVVAALQRPSAAGLVLLLAGTCWTAPARLMRAATLQVRALPYVEAARAAGLPARRILLRHVWPATWPVQMVRFPLTVALLIGLETTLSFLGIGLPPEIPSWGRLLAAVRFSPGSWWLLLGPGVALGATLLSLHTLMARSKSQKYSFADVTKQAYSDQA
ncbi:ABC transporter permease [Hymenobacter weizhouensis]|uniref:ABC transporter permease n=1 Tax=Hymenobacter sp. YIM 151500-1 TaxID=2987689 RepID=UPI002225E55C|nr:ABC transporter permease [Hymenobacter sp. YIM 151500-1]UYZ63043.1 ABC transporter permease [Hymenobacter sp. YIM 151500-1]